MKKSYYLLFLLLPISLLLNCAKIPERVENLGITIEKTEENNKDVYVLHVGSGIKNENSDIAFIDYKGKINFVDPKKDGEVVDTIEFNVPVVLPFSTAIIDARVKRSEEGIKPLIDLLFVDRERLIKEKKIEKLRVNREFYHLKTLSYRKKNIIDLLKEKINEKNK